MWYVFLRPPEGYAWTGHITYTYPIQDDELDGHAGAERELLFGPFSYEEAAISVCNAYNKLHILEIRTNPHA